MTLVIELADDPDLSDWTELTEVKRETLRCGGIANKTEIGTGSGFDWWDDAGGRILPGRRPIRVIETATSPDTTLFYGRVSVKGLRRGIIRTGDAKELGNSLDDRNADLYGIIVDQWVRPAETDVARVQALLADYLSGASSSSPRARVSTDLADTYVASSPTIALPAETYVDSSPAQVLQEIVAITGKECFVTVDGELFYDAPTSTAYASTYSITDDDPDMVDELPPIWDGDAASEDPSELLSGARAKYGVNSAVVSDSRAPIEAAFDKWEDTVFLETSSAAQAALFLDTLLDNQGIEEKSRSCTIEVPEDQVDRIKWGQTISFRAAAADDLTPVTLRISYLLWEVPIAPGAPYYAHLELSKPKKIAPRIKKGSNPGAVIATPRAPLDPGVLTGTHLGTEHWPDAEYTTFNGHQYQPPTPFFDPDNPLIAQPTAIRAWVTAASGPVEGSSRGGTFIRHTAPAGAAWARLRASVWARRFHAVETQLAFVAVQLPLPGIVWGGPGPPGNSPEMDQVGTTVWSRTFFTEPNPATPAGPFPMECVIPVIDGELQFIFADVGDVSDPTPATDESWYTTLFDQSEAYGGPLKYTLDFYGVSTVAIGDWVRPVAIALGDDTETIYSTPYPYTPGSLEAYVEGTRQEAVETDPSTGLFTLAYPPPTGSLVAAAFVVADLTQTGVPIDPVGRELGPVPGTGIVAVGPANSAGTSRDYASEDHVHEGVNQIFADGAAVDGDVVLLAGTNVTITRSGQDLTFAASGGGGGGSTRIQDFAADAVTFDTGIIYFYDQNQDANIGIDAGIYLTTVGDGIYMYPDTGTVVEIDGGDGLILPRLASDPSSPSEAQIVYRTDTDLIRLRANGEWVYLPWFAASGSATITSGNTSVTVTHGAGFDPIDTRGIQVFPSNNPTNDPGWFWVSNVGGTTFQINVRANPGASGATFVWKVVNR